MNLVIVESPAKAKTIEKYLGKEFKVLASFGHVRELPAKDGSVDTENDFAMKFIVSEKSKKHINNIINLVTKAKQLILATDPDREGEAIAWHVLQELIERKKISTDNIKVSRVVFNEITKPVVIEAIKNARDIDMKLVDAQQARQSLDYLVGFNISPILWRKLPGSKSAGRVQSVALRIVCDRETEIENFVSKEYWDLTLKLSYRDAYKNTKSQLIDSNVALDAVSGVSATDAVSAISPNAKPSDTDIIITSQVTHVDSKELKKFSLTNKEDVDKIINHDFNKEFTLISKTKKIVKRNPPQPFTTSSLQQATSSKLGLSVKNTMQIAQKLYEGIAVNGQLKGLITYMRTDGIDISETVIPKMRNKIEKDYGAKYLPSKARKYKNKVKNAQEAHEAIRPTDFTLDPKSIKQFLSPEQYRLYELIWNRSLACQMAVAQFEQTVLIIENKDKYIKARTSGMVQKFDGYLKIYQDNLEENNTKKTKTKNNKDDKNQDNNKQDKNSTGKTEKLVELPDIPEGQKFKYKDMIGNQHFTQPPGRYSEASLVKELEVRGIGRPSTYASMISVLLDREYTILQKKKFHPTQRGRIVCSFLKEFFTKYVEYEFTANLEQDLDKISNGDRGKQAFLKEFWQPFSQQVNTVQDKSNKEVLSKISENLNSYLYKSDQEKQCTKCKTGKMVLGLSKYGAFLGCSQYPDCKNIVNLDNTEYKLDDNKIDYTANDSDNTQNKNNFANQKPQKYLGKGNNNDEIYIKKGPYGWYIEAVSNDINTQKEKKDPRYKPKRASIPPEYNIADDNIDDISLEQAKKLVELPKVVGQHPETKKDIIIGYSKYGPYILHDGKYVNIKTNMLEEDEKVVELGINRLVVLIADYSSKTSAKNKTTTSSSGKILGQHPETKKDIILYAEGKYGPYLKYNGKNYKISKDTNTDELNIDSAIEIIDK